MIYVYRLLGEERETGELFRSAPQPTHSPISFIFAVEQVTRYDCTSAERGRSVKTRTVNHSRIPKKKEREKEKYRFQKALKEKKTVEERGAGANNQHRKAKCPSHKKRAAAKEKKKNAWQHKRKRKKKQYFFSFLLLSLEKRKMNPFVYTRVNPKTAYQM